MIAYLLIAIGTIPTNARLPLSPDLSNECQHVEQFLCDISFGERQLEQFICDRPDTAEIIKRESVLRNTLVWHFAGSRSGNRIYWDCREPKSGRPAEHSPAYWDNPVLIRVTKDKIVSGIDKSTMLLFELLNFRVDEEYSQLINAVAEDRKSRREFAISCIRHEFAAIQKTRWFFLEHPIAGANPKRDSNYCMALESTDSFSDYVHWLDGLDRKEFNPLNYYGEAYDNIMPYKRRDKGEK